MGEVGTRASEAEGPFSRREEGWELGEKESKRVEIQPTHRSGMGLKAKKQNKKTKSWGVSQRINIRRSIEPKQGDEEISTKSVMLGFYRGFWGLLRGR